MLWISSKNYIQYAKMYEKLKISFSVWRFDAQQHLYCGPLEGATTILKFY